MALTLAACGKKGEDNNTGGDIEKETFRSIKVYEIEKGSADVERKDVGSLSVYNNMQLQDQDKFLSHDESFIELQIDSDKYALVEPNTRFSIEASGTAKDSKTRINLEEGAITTAVKEKLSSDSYYEVKTPNSVMAIRGTAFRIEVRYDLKGISHTKLEVFEGKVECRLIFPDGTTDSNSVFAEPGSTITMWGNSDTADYDEGGIKIDYSQFDREVLEFLGICIDRGHDIEIDRSEINKLIANMGDGGNDDNTETSVNNNTNTNTVTNTNTNNTTTDTNSSTSDSGTGSDSSGSDSTTDDNTTATSFTVTFTYNGSTFATQTVESGQKASKPTLVPAEGAGSWNFNFDTLIEADTTVDWVMNIN